MVTMPRRRPSDRETAARTIDEPVRLREILPEVLQRHGLATSHELRGERIHPGDTSRSLPRWEPSAASPLPSAVPMWDYLPLP